MIEARVFGALARQRLEIVRKAALRHCWTVDDREDAVDEEARADLRPVEGLDQGLGEREARGFDDDVLGRRVEREQRLDRRDEVVGDRAAKASIRELDDMRRRAILVATARRMSPSTPTSPNSLMTSARRRSCVASTRCRMSVVFPAPRKPVTMVAGILPLMLASQFWRAGQRRARGAESGAAWGAAKTESKIMVVSLPPRRRRLTGFRRQVSWLAGQRLAPPSRGFTSAVAFGAASPLTVAGAAAGSESSSPRSLFTSREEPSALF